MRNPEADPRKDFNRSIARGTIIIKHPEQSDDEDADSYTERSTIASSESDILTASAMSTFKQSVMGKLKKSARGLAKSSAMKLSPVLTSGPSHPASVPQVAKPTPKHSVRQRRRSFASKLRLRLQRINKDPLVTSRMFLAITATCLLTSAGNHPYATCWSVIALAILRETIRHCRTKPLEVWYFISAITVAISSVSFLVWKFLGDTTSKGAWYSFESDKVWVWGRGLPRMWGLILGYILYQDVASSNDEEEDKTVDTWSVQISLLRAKNMGTSHCTGALMVERNSLRNCTIRIKHGPIELGCTDAQDLLNDSQLVEGDSTPIQLQHVVFSHFIESQSTVECQIVSNSYTTNGQLVGTAQIVVPKTPNVKVVSWYPIMSNGKTRQLGELLVEIQTNPSPQQFLLRGTTLTTLMVLIAAYFLQ